MDKVYDVIIIGSGPAGLAAGIYAARSGMSTLLMEKEKVGGQIVITDDVENYPGSLLENESGFTLTDRMAKQCDKFGVERKMDTIKELHLTESPKRLIGAHREYKAVSVIIATGAKPRLIGCPGEKELTGKGVSYCATCDGAFFEDLPIYVMGGGDSAVEEAIYLTKFGRKVTIIHRRDQLRAVKQLQDMAFKNEKIDFMWDSVIEEIRGEDIVESMVVKNVKTGELTEIIADEEDGTFGIFVFIGMLPQNELFKDILEMSPEGYIVTDDNMKANIPGVFAAGDIRVKSLRQVVTAAADGAIAASQAFWYVEEAK